MSSCVAIAMARDEADIAQAWCEHMLTQVDHLIVADNLSTDGTREIVASFGDAITLIDDPDPAYEQSTKMSALAARALSMGFTWAVASDLDEAWMTTDNRPIRVYLDGLAPDIRVVTAELFNHIPTAIDPAQYYLDPFSNEVIGGEPNPFRRIGWRKRERAPLPKVCVRLCDGLIIHMGNHSAYLPGIAPAAPGLVVRHYSWRTREQYVRKIATGAKAYALTDMPESTGGHWRMHGLPPDDPAALAEWEQRVGDHFTTWFYSPDPYADSSMIYDPAPL